MGHVCWTVRTQLSKVKYSMSGFLPKTKKQTDQKKKKKILLELILCNATVAHTSSDSCAQTDAEPPQSNKSHKYFSVKTWLLQMSDCSHKVNRRLSSC